MEFLTRVGLAVSSAPVKIAPKEYSIEESKEKTPFLSAVLIMREHFMEKLEISSLDNVTNKKLIQSTKREVLNEDDLDGEVVSKKKFCFGNLFIIFTDMSTTETVSKGNYKTMCSLIMLFRFYKY